MNKIMLSLLLMFSGFLISCEGLMGPDIENDTEEPRDNSRDYIAREKEDGHSFVVYFDDDYDKLWEDRGWTGISVEVFIPETEENTRYDGEWYNIRHHSTGRSRATGNWYRRTIREYHYNDLGLDYYGDDLNDYDGYPKILIEDGTKVRIYHRAYDTGYRHGTHNVIIPESVETTEPKEFVITEDTNIRFSNDDYEFPLPEYEEE